MGFDDNFDKALELSLEYFTDYITKYGDSGLTVTRMEDYGMLWVDVYTAAFMRAFGREKITNDFIDKSLHMLAGGLSFAFRTHKKMYPTAPFEELVEFLKEYIRLQFSDLNWVDTSLFDDESSDDVQEPTNPEETSLQGRPS